MGNEPLASIITVGALGGGGKMVLRTARRLGEPGEHSLREDCTENVLLGDVSRQFSSLLQRKKDFDA